MSLPANFDLTAFLRQTNAAHPFANEVLTKDTEGHPAYDCKGFTCLYRAGLMAAGADPDDIWGLSVDGGGTERHMVLQYKDVCLDCTQAYLTKPGDYQNPVKLDQLEMAMLQAELGIA